MNVPNLNQIRLAIFTVAALVAVQGAAYANQDSSDLQRTIRFINTIENPIQIFWMNNDGKPEHFADLDPQMEVDQQSEVGQQWVIRANDKDIATYQVDDSKEQFKDTKTDAMIDHVVDVKFLVSWQQPVEVSFMNTTNDPLDILWVDNDGVEHVYSIELKPGMEYVQTGAHPLDIWTVRKHGELACTYSISNKPVQQVDLKKLIDATKSRVGIVFQNTTNSPINVYWIDAQGQPVLYADAIPPGFQHTQMANPGQTWQIESNGAVIGKYVVQQGADVQIVDASKL